MAMANVLSTLRTLSCCAVAVTATHEWDTGTAAAWVPNDDCAAWLQLFIAPAPVLPNINAPRDPPAKVSIVAPETRGGASIEARPTPTSSEGRTYGIASMPLTSHPEPFAARRGRPEEFLACGHLKALQDVRRLPRSDKFVAVGRYLEYMSDSVFSDLMARMKADPEGLCGHPNFPKTLLRKRSPKPLRRALVAGLARDSTWGGPENHAAVVMLDKFDSRELDAQLGALVVVRKHKCMCTCSHALIKTCDQQ